MSNLLLLLLFSLSAVRHCPVDKFQCNNTLCKPLAWKCDGEDDCGDNSDEKPEECSECSFADLFSFIFSCHPVLVLSLLVCPSSPLPPSTFLGRFQCPPTRTFRCQNDRVCLQVSKRCDGVNNCGDNSDEMNCREFTFDISCPPQALIAKTAHQRRCVA